MRNIFLAFLAVTLTTAGIQAKSPRTQKHEQHIRECISLAQQARDKGNRPFAAVLVHQGAVLLRAEDSVITERDDTKHAEMRIVAAATKKFPNRILQESILYVSTEPCAMCTGAIYWSHIGNVVYGCSAETMGQFTDASFTVPSREVLKYGTRIVRVEGPVLEAEAAKVHIGFWDKK
ncbi:MAG: nucleoside deaminase [Alphaproteobacteria bacterium]